MKKFALKISFTILFLALVVLGSSQEKKLSFQVSVGPNFNIPKTSVLQSSEYDNVPELKTKFGTGFFVEPELRWDINENFFFEGGLQFTMNKINMEYSIGITLDEGKRTVTELKVPVNINYFLSPDKTFSVGLGFFTGFLMSAKEKGIRTIDYRLLNIIDPDEPIMDITQEDYSENIKSRYNEVYFGLFLQLQKDLNLMPNNTTYVFLRFNQYLNRHKSPKTPSEFSEYFTYEKEKESQIVDFGVGIRF